MRMIIRIVAIPAVLFCSMIWPHSSHASDVLGMNVTNGQFEVILPGASASNAFRMVDWSTNLIEWEMVARDYGFDWENTFPHALPVSTGA